VTKSDYSQQTMLMCLRLAAECNNLAGEPAVPDHRRAGYLRTASMWMELAVTAAGCAFVVVNARRLFACLG